MGDRWFVEPGLTGTLPIERREDGWYATPSDADDDIKCLFESEIDPDRFPEQGRVRVTVTSYKFGDGDGLDHLFVSRVDRQDGSNGGGTNDEQPTGDDRTCDTSQRDPRNGHPDDERACWDLVDFRGSGEFVTVRAVVDSIFRVDKDDPNSPDIQGTLVDESVKEPVEFVVWPGVKHPYLEEGTRFEFSGVKDHYYDPKDQVQVAITERTEFTELDSARTADSPVDRSRSGTDGKRSGSGANDSLRNIADELGKTTFTLTREDRESVVGSAKKRARREGRDPAIDPRLQDSNDSTTDGSPTDE